MKFLGAFLIISFALGAQVIEGTVVNSSTKLPLSGATVTIESGGKAVYQATTDFNGVFRIEGVTAGQYTAKFSKTEFLPPAADAATRPFRIAAGSEPLRLEAQLTPMGKVSGRVFDVEGHSVPGAELLLDSSSMGQTATSDQQGNFTFLAAPGNYILSARPPGGLKPPAARDDGRLGWVDTYFPGVPERSLAAKIMVAAGSELWGTDIPLRFAPVYCLRGVVIDTMGDPVARLPVKATPIDETLPTDIRTVSAEDGSFEFPALPNGEWVVSAEMAGGSAKLRAFVLEHVAGRDLNRVELRLSTPFTVRGSVSFDGSDSRKPRTRVAIFLRPLIGAAEGLPQGILDQDGTFKIENVYPGPYKIVAVSPGPPYYLASLSMGDREVLGQSLELSPGALPIKIVFESKGGGVRGAVDDCGSATIVLQPQDSALQEPQFIQTARCGEGGRFQVANLRPGYYYAFAFDKWDGPRDLISSFDQSLANKAVTVNVHPGEVASIDLRVTFR